MYVNTQLDNGRLTIRMTTGTSAGVKSRLLNLTTEPGARVNRRNIILRTQLTIDKKNNIIKNDKNDTKKARNNIKGNAKNSNM